jgi:nitroreductase
MDALEAMETCRAMRWLKSDPVPEELIRKVLRAATCASSPGNSQGWDFVVVRDPALRKQIAEIFRTEVKPRILPVPESADGSRKLMSAGALHLLDTLDRVPVLIFVCGAAIYPPASPMADFVPAALYPAAQNLIVAARALGLGTVFTTFHMLCEPPIRALLELPEGHRIQVTIPLGWPEKKFGPVKRRPLDDVVHWDRF